MTEDHVTSILTASELAHLGEGKVGYVRKMTSDDLLAAYPGIADIAPGLEISHLVVDSEADAARTDLLTQRPAGPE